MKSKVAASPLSRTIRWTAVFCVVLSGVSGLFAASEAMGLAHFSELKEASESPRYAWMGDPKLTQKALETQLAALEPMREPRSLVLGALAIACAMTFVASARILRPAGLPREGLRRLLIGAAVASAVLRTIDGAQWAVVAKRMGQGMAQQMMQLPAFSDPAAAAQVQDTLPSLIFGGALVQTFLVVGAFVGVAQFFRSERVRKALDENTPPAENTGA